MTHLGSVKGDIAEKRVLLTAKSLRPSLPWITGARMATYEEDRDGIDVWVETDIGDIPIQVKWAPTSGITGTQRIKYESAGAFVVFAGSHVQSPALRAELRGILRRARKRAMADAREEAEWAKECEA